jgi:hypothetical protein
MMGRLWINLYVLVTLIYIINKHVLASVRPVVSHTTTVKHAIPQE